MEAKANRRPLGYRDSAQRFQSERVGVLSQKDLDKRSLQPDQVGQKRKLLGHWQIFRRISEMTGSLCDRRMVRRVVDQVLGDEVVEVDVADNSCGRGEVFFDSLR